MDALRFLNSPMLLVPAYGHRYATPEEIAFDWESGEDFRIIGGSYCSVRNIDVMRETSSSITIMDTSSGASYQVG